MCCENLPALRIFMRSMVSALIMSEAPQLASCSLRWAFSRGRLHPVENMYCDDRKSVNSASETISSWKTGQASIVSKAWNCGEMGKETSAKMMVFEYRTSLSCGLLRPIFTVAARAPKFFFIFNGCVWTSSWWWMELMLDYYIERSFTRFCSDFFVVCQVHMMIIGHFFRSHSFHHPCEKRSIRQHSWTQPPT